MKKLLISLTVLIVASITMSSCLKNASPPDPGYNVNEVGINTTTLLEIPLDLYLQVDRAIRLQRDSIIYKHINGTPFNFNMGYINLSVSPADTTTYPKTITLDFGTDALNPYQGKMTIVMNKDMRTLGAKSLITYQNLTTDGSTIRGNDSIVSLGINSSGSIVSRFYMPGGDLKGYNSEKVNYSGNVIAKYNRASNLIVLDSVAINGTDPNLNSYKLYSVDKSKLQLSIGCNYFNQGIIGADIKVNNVLTGNLLYDYSYGAQGTQNDCDADIALFMYSKINANFQQQYAIGAKKFE